jgi:hypothetical protein
VLAGIDEIENVWITLADGCRIAARIWRPSDAMAAPVPAILEYIPYRKRDFMRARDEPIHRYFALKGYASVRVDIRGSGDSDGLLEDEYSLQEHRDAVEIIAWLAAQPWCSGKVGMMGISWGGFNALQVAALRPPALKAIVTLCSTDDRYADDAHYMGGCLLNENLQWGSILTLYGALPPDPEIVGARWREMWRQRIEALEAFPALWMRHPWRDDYWRHGSVCQDYAAIRCAVYAIGGWADGYSNAVPRLLANLNCPKKGLIGPWAHVFPHNGAPGPAIGFLQEAVRWWDRWLKGIDNDIMVEPVYRAWMQEWVPPRPTYETRPGRWVAEASWPSPRIRERVLHLNAGTLEPSAAAGRVLSFRSPQTTGLGSGEWCAFGSEGEMPTDQRPDDGGSLIFDSGPLAERLEILGAPAIELDLASDKPAALIAARLSDVAPDGSALRVSYALLNLCHRDGHARPKALVPGRWYRVRLQLNDIAHAFQPGHRLRLALSTSYWPMAWPSPEPAVLSIRTGNGWLELPERPPRAEDDALRPFEAAEAAPATTRRTRPPLNRLIETDLGSNETTYTVQTAFSEAAGPRLARIEAIDLELGYSFAKRHRITEGEPLSALSEFTQTARLQRGDWSVRIECRGRVTATLQAFEFTGDLEAFEGGARFARREWRLSIPRQLL